MREINLIQIEDPEKTSHCLNRLVAEGALKRLDVTLYLTLLVTADPRSKIVHDASAKSIVDFFGRGISIHTVRNSLRRLKSCGMVTTVGSKSGHKQSLFVAGYALWESRNEPVFSLPYYLYSMGYEKIPEKESEPIEGLEPNLKEAKPLPDFWPGQEVEKDFWGTG